MNFEGKVAAVTGGGSGIGLALAGRLASLGWRVAVGDVRADRLDPAQLEAFADRTEREFGAVHLVRANAGIIGPLGERLREVPDAAWRRVIDVNLLGVVSTLRAFVPRILAHPPGHVGIIASMAAVTTNATMPAYYATKHALLSIADTLRLQLDRDSHDVGVSVLLPGQVTTRLGESVSDVDTPGNPRGLSPDEVADRFVEAVHDRRPYVFTRRGSARLAQARIDAVTG